MEEKKEIYKIKTINMNKKAKKLKEVADNKDLLINELKKNITM